MAAMPASSAWAALLYGLSPICSSMTSLPWALSRLATARTSKAVSVERPRANWLKETVEFVMEVSGMLCAGFPVEYMADAGAGNLNYSTQRAQRTQRQQEIGFGLR